MKISRIILAVAIFAFSASLPAAIIDPTPYLKLDEFEDIKISPNGDYFAATVPLEDRTVLAILRASDRKMTANIGLGRNLHVADVWWVSPERVIIAIAQRFGQRDRPALTGELAAINADGSGAEALIGARVEGVKLGSRISAKKGDQIAAILVDTLPQDDRFVIVQTLPFNTDPFSKVERMDVQTGRRNVLGRAPVRNASFVTDNAGVVRLASGFNPDRIHRLFHRADDQAEWQEITDEGSIETPIGFSADNRTAYLNGTQPKGPDAVVALDTTTMKRSIVLRDEHVDPYEMVYSASGSTPLGAAFMDARYRTAFIDENGEDARLHRMLEKAFGDQAVRITSRTRDGQQALVQVWSDRSPGDYFIFNVATKKADHLLTSRSWLDPESMGATRAVVLEARDGTALRGYVTVPNGSDGKNLPMVVMPHGGPFGEFDTWGFDPEVQMLAASGYAVLQVNFRGSSNYGRTFAESGKRQWGRTMQDDVTDATHWAIKQGIADGKRLCIHGASYGGYAALMGAAREPTLYRCASGYVGVYDLAILHTEGDVQEAKSGETYVREWIGERESLAAVSPNLLADRITVPVLLAAGGEDRRAPIAHTKMMEKALRKAGVPVEALYFDDEGHGFYLHAHKMEYYTKLLQFLDRHIGDAVAAR
jgi:dipeptidyl aminopeptidase/acylaminoacyl peptidase